MSDLMVVVVLVVVVHDGPWCWIPDGYLMEATVNQIQDNVVLEQVEIDRK